MRAEKRGKATPNCGDCGNSRPRIGRNLSLGREKRKCLPRFGQRAGESDDLPEDARAVVEWVQSDPTRCVKAATASYFVDLRESLREVRRVLKSGGKCAYVVARRHVFYRYQSREVVRIVESADLTAQLALQAGLRLLELVHVELQKQNTVARPRSLDAYYETIVLLQRDS